MSLGKHTFSNIKEQNQGLQWTDQSEEREKEGKTMSEKQ